MSEPTERRRHMGTPRLVDPKGAEDKTQVFLKTYMDAMKEIFTAKPSDPQPIWNPKIPVFSVVAVISSTDQSQREILNVNQVGSSVADKAAEFCRFLALELRPGETLMVKAERHEDIPIGMAAHVFMTQPA